MGLKKEICYTVDRLFRVCEDNFWYKVEERTPLRWHCLHRTRDKFSAHNWMIHQYWARQAEIVRKAFDAAKTPAEYTAAGEMELRYFTHTGHHIPW